MIALRVVIRLLSGSSAFAPAAAALNGRNAFLRFEAQKAIEENDNLHIRLRNF
jgi:hypothetical protein